jgi:hypothetical protein
MPLPFTRRGIDPDAADFCSRSGASDRAALSAFVRGVKDLGLWESMVCWPLRSSQNIGNLSTTAYSLGGLGTFDGELVNGPTWGVDGIDFSAATSQTKTDAFGLPTFPMSKIVVGQRVSGSGSASWEYIGTGSGASRSFAKRAYANNSMGTSIVGVAYVTLVSNGAQTLTDNFEMATAIIPNATNANGEVFINTTKPTQTAGVATWGANASTAGLLAFTGDLVFRASFHATFTTAINTSAFYTLYRATLGTGLGLP